MKVNAAEAYVLAGAFNPHKQAEPQYSDRRRTGQRECPIMDIPRVPAARL